MIFSVKQKKVSSFDNPVKIPVNSYILRAHQRKRFYESERLHQENNLISDREPSYKLFESAWKFEGNSRRRIHPFSFSFLVLFFLAFLYLTMMIRSDEGQRSTHQLVNLLIYGSLFTSSAQFIKLNFHCRSVLQWETLTRFKLTLQWIVTSCRYNSYSQQIFNIHRWTVFHFNPD